MQLSDRLVTTFSSFSPLCHAIAYFDCLSSNEMHTQQVIRPLQSKKCKMQIESHHSYPPSAEFHAYSVAVTSRCKEHRNLRRCRGRSISRAHTQMGMTALGHNIRTIENSWKRKNWRMTMPSHPKTPHKKRETLQREGKNDGFRFV